MISEEDLKQLSYLWESLSDEQRNNQISKAAGYSVCESNCWNKVTDNLFVKSGFCGKNCYSKDFPIDYIHSINVVDIIESNLFEQNERFPSIYLICLRFLEDSINVQNPITRSKAIWMASKLLNLV